MKSDTITFIQVKPHDYFKYVAECSDALGLFSLRLESLQERLENLKRQGYATDETEKAIAALKEKL